MLPVLPYPSSFAYTLLRVGVWWCVTFAADILRSTDYRVVAEYLHDVRKHGRVAEIFDAAKVRSTVPPEVAR